jgi:hypothetical protein
METNTAGTERKILERMFKFLYANRTASRLLPEFLEASNHQTTDVLGEIADKEGKYGDTKVAAHESI